MSRKPFRSKNDAMNRRIHSWWCLTCDARYYTKRKMCECGSMDLHYFPSEAEAHRFAALKLELRCGLISDLELQPSYPVVLDGTVMTTYKADFRYMRDGVQVVEDVKGNEEYLTDLFKLKRKLIEHIYKLRLTIT